MEAMAPVNLPISVVIHFHEGERPLGLLTHLGSAGPSYVH
jgi:hypothetical protein